VRVQSAYDFAEGRRVGEGSWELLVVGAARVL
jgi:hypothetical protein